MPPIVPILCGIALIAGFVGLFMSRETWRWHTITFTFLVLVGSLVWFYLAARTLKTHEVWRTEVANYEALTTKVDTENESLLHGIREENEWKQLSLGMLKTQVESILEGRGRMWPGALRKSVDRDSGLITATVEQPDPHGIEPKTILFVFDDKPANEGGEFLGEFEVTAVNGPDVQLTPVLKLRPGELTRIAKNANAGLTLYEIMPLDSRHLLDDLTDQERQEMFHASVPAEVKQDFVRDGKPAEQTEIDSRPTRVWNRVKAMKTFTMKDGEEEFEVTEGTELVLDPKSTEERIAAGEVAMVEGDNKVFVRELRDYARLYRDFNLQIDAVNRGIAETTGQIAAVAEAQTKVNNDIKYRSEERDNLKRDLTRFQSETKLITDFVAALEKRVASLRGELKQVFDTNRKLAAELNALQRAAADEMNRRAPPANVTAN